MIRTSLAVSLALVATALQQEPEADVDRYPQVREERVLRYFGLKGRLDAGELNEALKEADLELAYGPVEAASRPANSVVAVSVPFDLKVRDVERALKKAKVKTEELEVFLYRGRIENGFPTFGIGLEKIDYMLGISGEIKWCDMRGDWTQFYCVDGKLEAQDIEDLWQKLQRPLGTEPATLGEVVGDTLTWTLSRDVDEREWKKLSKAIGALDGVKGARLDGRTLHLELEMAGLNATGLVGVFEGEPEDPTGPPRATFASRELWDLLAGEELVPTGG